MSAQRHSSSAPGARFNPLSRILSPVVSLTHLIRSVYHPKRRETLGPPAVLGATALVPTRSGHSDSDNVIHGRSLQGNALVPHESGGGGGGEGMKENGGNRVADAEPRLDSILSLEFGTDSSSDSDYIESSSSSSASTESSSDLSGPSAKSSNSSSDSDYVPSTSSASSSGLDFPEPSSSSTLTESSSDLSGPSVKSSDSSSDPDYVPSTSSASSSTTITSSTKSYIYISSSDSGILNLKEASQATASVSHARQMCQDWAKQAPARSDPESGEIVEAPEILEQSAVGLPSEAPSELAIARVVRRVRTYKFRDSFSGGRLKFDPPLPGPPSINRWMFHPTRITGLMADNSCAVGDVDFNPAPGGGFEYFVYSEAPGTNDREYGWFARQIGCPHPHVPGYVLHHYPEHAPIWVYQPWME
ncbi:hypothetical protein FRC08_010417 [Ceratobasidium sp. 394]|nr:hypothetical protein FRC08_010417 [Ceratobasidium sp. 394]